VPPLHCSTCKRSINRLPAWILGPPDHAGKIKQSGLCRLCYFNLLDYLRRLARAESRRAVTPSETLRSRRSNQAA